MHLKTLAYVSRASLDLTERDLLDILRSARNRNALEGITGLLVFNGVRFLQIVEGSEEAIDALVSRLRADPRHNGFEVRDERKVLFRSFADWSMQLVKVDSDVLTSRDQVNDILPDALDDDIRTLVMQNTMSIGGPVRLPD